MPAPTSDSGEPNLRSPLIKKSAEVEKVCIDEMLQKYCGEFGAYQLRHFVLTCLAWALEAFHTMVMIFADREPDWRCVAEPCSDSAETVCGLQPGSWEWIGGTSSSTVAEWGLVCGEKYKVGLVQALFFAGCMIGQLSLSLSRSLYYNFFIPFAKI